MKRIRIYYKYHCTRFDMVAYIALTYSLAGAIVLALGLI